MQAIDDFLHSNQVTVLSADTQKNYKYALASFQAFHEALSENQELTADSGIDPQMSFFCDYLKKYRKKLWPLPCV